MDRKKTNATASPNTGKKDENFFTKTAHSIRDKVQVLKDDVKEKTQNLTRSSESKKNKNQKKTDTKLKTTSKPQTASKKDSESDSDIEDHQPKPRSPVLASAIARKDNRQDIRKFDSLGPKPTTTTAAISKTLSEKPASRELTIKPSDDNKNAVAAPPPSPASFSNESLPSTHKQDKTTSNGDTTNKPSSVVNNKDQIHISFDGISTVDDLLDRIDEAIERAKIIVENGKGTINVSIGKTPPAPIPSLADLEKIPVEKFAKHKNKIEEEDEDEEEEDEDEDEDEDEPIRINYNEIHKVEDLLVRVNQQPGHRKVVLENAPNNSGSVTIQKQLNSPHRNPLTPTNSNDSDFPSPPPTPPSESDDLSVLPKSILKTTHDPPSFQDDEGVNNLAEHIIDDAIHTVMDTKSQEEKQEATQLTGNKDEGNDESDWI